MEFVGLEFDRDSAGPLSGLEVAAVAYPGIFLGGHQIQLRAEDREKGALGVGSPLVRGSGGSCNLVQVISFHIVKQFLAL